MTHTEQALSASLTAVLDAWATAARETPNATVLRAFRFNSAVLLEAKAALRAGPPDAARDGALDLASRMAIERTALKEPRT